MVDIRRHWLSGQDRSDLSFSSDRLRARLEVACKPSGVGKPFVASCIAAEVERSAIEADRRRFTVAADTTHSVHDIHDVGACERPAKYGRHGEPRDGEDFIEALQNARPHGGTSCSSRLRLRVRR